MERGDIRWREGRGGAGILVGEGGGGRGKSPALSMFIMIRDATMLWHHVSLGTVTPHPAAANPLPPRSPQNAFLGRCRRRPRIHPKM